MKPDEILDMSLPVFRACVAGYEDHLFDLQLLAVHGGFWSGYYSNSKKPKPLGTILKKLIREKDPAKHKSPHADTVDVEAFLERERRFKERMRTEGYERK